MSRLQSTPHQLKDEGYFRSTEMNKRILIAAISLVLTGPTYAAIIAYNDEDAKQDDNWYLAGERAPDQTRILSSGGIVRIWHTDSANFFGLPPIPMPHLTCITITDKERRVKASIYIKDGVNRWIKGEQYLLKLRNVAEARTVSKWCGTTGPLRLALTARFMPNGVTIWMTPNSRSPMVIILI